MKYLGVDPGLDSLHGDLRFNDLMRRVGLKPLLFAKVINDEA